MGNIPETFSLSWEDRLGELGFDPKRATATVPPGETVKVPYQVSRAQTLWFSRERINSFKVNISSQSAQAQSHTGSFFSRALIPPWALIALISLCLISCCPGHFFQPVTGYRFRCQSDRITRLPDSRRFDQPANCRSHNRHSIRHPVRQPGHYPGHHCHSSLEGRR